MQETRKCPFCAEGIRAEAVRCPHCRSRLSGVAAERWHREQPQARLAGVAAAVAAAFAVPVALVRLGFVALTFLHLLGPLLYGLLWLVIPASPGQTSLAEEAAGGLSAALAGRHCRRDQQPCPRCGRMEPAADENAGLASGSPCTAGGS
jgi:phage shock protein C